MNDAILAWGLSHVYRGSGAGVHALDLRVPRGGIVGLLGPNGAGKTTTLRMLTGLLRPTAGDATVLGLDVRRDAGAIKARVAYQPQRDALYGDLTAEENVRFLLGLQGIPRSERRAIAAASLDATGLEHVAGRLARVLSGGERRRLALACAVALRQELLVLDEPTAGLDPVAREEVWKLLHELRRSGTTVLVTTHHMDEADRATQLAILIGGRVVAQGTPQELRRAHPHRIVDVEHATRASVAELLASRGVVRATVHGDRLRVAVGSEGTAELGRALGDGAVLHEAAPTLGDVYLELASRAGAP